MNSEDIFDRLQNDPHAWMEQADCLLLSSKLAQDKFMEVQKVPPTTPGNRIQRLAFFDTFMMLTAFAFENLIKGLGVAKGMNWKSDFHEQGGHGIADYSPRVITVSVEERELLRRLQAFSIWAGRYPIPTTTGRYHADAPNRGFSFPRDVELIEKLYARLKCEILSAKVNH